VPRFLEVKVPTGHPSAFGAMGVAYLAVVPVLVMFILKGEKGKALL
jgi:hypothetical protein